MDVPGGIALSAAIRSRMFSIGGMNTDSSAKILQHIDTGPSVRRVHHEVHRPVGFEHGAQGSEARIRILEMVENSGAHDLIEARLQVAYTLDWQLVDLEIVQAVFPLEVLRMPHTRRADVYAGDLCRRPAHGMLRRLRCAAAGNEDRLVFSVGSARPK